MKVFATMTPYRVGLARTSLTRFL